MVKKDLVTSIMFSLGVIFLIASAAFRSLRYGLYTLVPLLTGLMVNFVLMVLFAIPLDATTFMVSSVTISVGVDDAIHFLFQYRRQREKNPDDMLQVLTYTLGITGRPILHTTAAIVSGLLMLVTASFKPIVYFGILVVVAMSATCMATMFVLPAFLVVDARRRKFRDKTRVSDSEKITI